MKNEDLMEALGALATEKGISTDTLLGTLADALESAYKRQPGAYEYAWVTIDPDTGDMRVIAQELDDDGEPHGPEIDVTPDSATMGRIAAQTFRQVMMQRLREVDREMKYEEYAGREGDIVTGIIQQSDSRYTLLDLGRVEALLPQAEQVPYERPAPDTRLKAYIVEVRKTSKGPQIVVSRTHPGLIKRLFELEVPEIADGVVEIKACAREPGHRTKIAVWSNDSNVDPVGACVGARGARVRQVVNELQGEKIDIVPFSEDAPDFVAKALSPAKVKEVRIHEFDGRAEVIVPDYQLSLAIGKEGQNARLAARLTGWRVDIKSETQLAEEEAYQSEEWAQGEWVLDPATGEQVWHSAEGEEEMSAEQWQHGGDEDDPAGTGAAAEAAEGAAAAEADEDGPASESDMIADEATEQSIEHPAADPDGDGVPGADEIAGSGVAEANITTEAGGPIDPLEIDSEPAPEEQAIHVVSDTDAAAEEEWAAAAHRTCIGCRHVAPTSELVRVVVRATATGEGSLEIGRTLAGRGAWLCAGSVACLDLAARRRAFGRALRVPVTDAAINDLRVRLGPDSSPTTN